MFAPDFVPEYLTTRLLCRHPHLQDVVVNVIYPNYAVVSDDGQKCVIFSHGHYVESLYSLMSSLNTMIFPNRVRPRVVWDVEAENFAWVDFFWSTMGRSGGAGQDIGLVYDKLQDDEQVKKLIANLSRSLVEKYSSTKWAEGVEERSLTWLLDLILGRRAALERHKLSQLL